jgi:TPR repeat protein
LRALAGIGEPCNYELAYRYFQQSEKQGYEDAPYELGRMLKLGIGVAKNRELAKDYYRRASYSYRTKRDAYLALGEVDRAAEAGNPYAQFRLGDNLSKLGGQAFAFGHGSVKNKEARKKLLEVYYRYLVFGEPKIPGRRKLIQVFRKKIGLGLLSVIAHLTQEVQPHERVQGVGLETIKTE